MQKSDFTVGTRVRLTKRIGGNYPGAMYLIEPGPTGVVIEVGPDIADTVEDVRYVRFDQRIEDLDTWGNVLHVIDDGDATTDDFEVIR